MFYIIAFFLIITIFLYSGIRKLSRQQINKLVEFKEV